MGFISKLFGVFLPAVERDVHVPNVDHIKHKATGEHAEQLTRFIAAYTPRGIDKDKYAGVFEAAPLVLGQIPTKHQQVANRHLVALFDKSGADVRHWQLMIDHLDRIDKDHREEYLRGLAQNSDYGPRDVIPYDEFFDLAMREKHKFYHKEPEKAVKRAERRLTR